LFSITPSSCKSCISSSKILNTGPGLKLNFIKSSPLIKQGGLIGVLFLINSF